MRSDLDPSRPDPSGLDSRPDPSRPDPSEPDASRTDRFRVDLLWRLLVPVAAVLALAAGAPRAVAGGLALTGLALAAERLVRLRRAGPADGVLVGVGGILVVLVLSGILLDLVHVALRPASWVVALAVLGLVGLLIAAVLPPRPSAATGPVGRASWATAAKALPWAAIAVVVVVVSVRMSATSLTASDAPPLQMSFGQVSGTKVQVVVSSDDAVGPLEVRTAAGGDDVSYPLFTVAGGGTATTTVSLPRTGRYVITLSYPDQTKPLRTLVLDR